MEQDFDLLAQSRANYFTQGSPIQFVRVELLKGTVTGEIAVCLTFKNVAEAPVSGLAVRFKCKGKSGEVLCEDQFYYEDLTAAKGDLFGADDAVFISDVPIGSVEVDLEQAFLADGSAVPLSQYKRVRLPAPKALPAPLAQQLQQRTGKNSLTVVPQMLEEGWYCACGAFHPKGEDDAYCSECGSDRILLQNSLSSLLQQGHQPAVQPTDEATRVVTNLHPEEPTRAMPSVGMTEQERFAQEYHSRGQAPAPMELMEDEEDEDDSDMRMMPERSSGRRSQEDYDPYEEPETYGRGRRPDLDDRDDRDALAAQIIRWAPPVTAGLCALVSAIGFVIYQLR